MQEQKRQRAEACAKAALVLTRMAIGFVARRRATHRAEKTPEATAPPKPAPQLARRPRPCRDGAACFYFRRGRCRFDRGPR